MPEWLTVKPPLAFSSIGCCRRCKHGHPPLQRNDAYASSRSVSAPCSFFPSPLVLEPDLPPPTTAFRRGIVGLLNAPPSLPSDVMLQLGSCSSPEQEEAVADSLTQILVDSTTELTFALPTEDEPSPLKEGWESFERPFWGVIADGVHVHPAALKMAYHSHPKGCVLTTDCTSIFHLRTHKPVHF